jgi:uncharacterized OB-fold protein
MNNQLSFYEVIMLKKRIRKIDKEAKRECKTCGKKTYNNEARCHYCKTRGNWEEVALLPLWHKFLFGE